MSLHFSFRKIEATDALKDHISKKVEKFKKYVTYRMEVFVTLSIEKQLHVAEITCRAEHHDLVALAKTENLYESIQEAVEKIETQMKKEREKKKGHNAARKNASGKMGADVEAELPHSEKRVRSPRKIAG